MPTFPPLNVPAILSVESPDGQSAILALNRDKSVVGPVLLSLYCALLMRCHIFHRLLTNPLIYGLISSLESIF